jgi:hypothetical protein
MNTVNNQEQAMIYFSTRLFSYNKNSKTFSTEMSTLDEGGKKQVFCQVYNDAADEGFTLISHQTGDEIKFALDHVERDQDDDILFWDLVPDTRDLRGKPQCKGLTIRIFND